VERPQNRKPHLKYMKLLSGKILLSLACAVSSAGLLAQERLVVVQAESGSLGSDYNSVTANGVTYITPLTNYMGNDLVVGGNGASRPNTATKVATYSVTFPQSGTYDLYIRVR